jgi:hypothetical protein
MKKYELFLVLIYCGLATSAQDGTPSLQEHFFDRLLKIPPQMQVLQTSSHNKTGMNWDEFWPQYVDKSGEEVIFDVAGPGCVKSMWGTHFDPDAVLNFYFDGEKTPRYSINYIDYYNGLLEGFPKPIVSYELRGRNGDRPYAGNSFASIPFEKHLKITVRGVAHFYHVLYEKYTDGHEFPTDNETNRDLMLRAFEETETIPVDTARLKRHVYRNDHWMPVGDADTIFIARNSAGVIRSLILETDGSEEFFEDVRIKMRWDGTRLYQVYCPAGAFFGSTHKADNMRSLPLRITKLGSGRVKLECYFPMAFWEGAEIILVNESGRDLGPLQAILHIGENDIPREDGTYFSTRYREGTTVYGQEWSLFEGTGSGWYVGTVQSMQFKHYCEGDEHFTIDGAVSPQINGTGSEDYYLACFWPNLDFDMPFACVVGDVGIEGGGHLWGYYARPACYNRFHLEAPIPFFNSINARIQHGGLNHIESQYRSLSYVYINKKLRLRKTDFIDVGNPVSEGKHAYLCTGIEEPVRRLSNPEGEYYDTRMEQHGRYHKGGSIRFSIAIDPDNNGVRLRRLLDQKYGPQQAEVLVDGKSAGIWYYGYRNETLSWYEHDFDIAASLTRGKGSLEIELQLPAGDREIIFTDFNYSVYSFME